MEEKQKRKWISPEIRSYGTFEAATQDICTKVLGSSDGFTFQGQPIVCNSGS